MYDLCSNKFNPFVQVYINHIVTASAKCLLNGIEIPVLLSRSNGSTICQYCVSIGIMHRYIVRSPALADDVDLPLASCRYVCSLESCEPIVIKRIDGDA